MLPNVTSTPEGPCSTMLRQRTSAERSSFHVQLNERGAQLLFPRTATVMPAYDAIALTSGQEATMPSENLAPPTTSTVPCRSCFRPGPIRAACQRCSLIG